MTKKQRMGKGKGERKMETEHSREKTGVDIDITQRLKWLGNRVLCEIGEWTSSKLRCLKISRWVPEKAKK